MPRTKQGVFRELLNRFRALELEFNNVVSEYQKDPSLVDFFSTMAYTSDDLYNELMQLSRDIHGMLLSTAMEQPETEEKYQGIENSVLNYEHELVRLFRERVEAIKNSGCGLTPAEQGTLDSLKIWCER